MAGTAELILDKEELEERLVTTDSNHKRERQKLDEEITRLKNDADQLKMPWYRREAQVVDDIGGVSG